MKNGTFKLGSAIALLFASGLAAAPVDLVVDPAQSSMSMSITVDIGLASDTDSDSTTLSGNIEIELDDTGNPSLISLNDMMIVMDQTMNFNWSFGFFGSADSTMTGGTMSYSTPGIPNGPVPINAGAFSFPGVLVDLGGILDVNYDIFLVGSGMETVNLADQGPTASDFEGNIMVVGDQVTASTTVPLDSTQPLTDADGNEIGTVTTTGTATIVAVGTAPTCPADLTGDGELNFFDVSAFLSAFAAMDLAADFNGDGELNFFDVSAFLVEFAAGCP